MLIKIRMYDFLRYACMCLLRRIDSIYNFFNLELECVWQILPGAINIYSSSYAEDYTFQPSYSQRNFTLE